MYIRCRDRSDRDGSIQFLCFNVAIVMLCIGKTVVSEQGSKYQLFGNTLSVVDLAEIAFAESSKGSSLCVHLVSRAG